MKNKAVLRNDNILKLSDGRQLSYTEYGDPNGQVVFLVHGTPGSRLYWQFFPGFPFRPDLHIIAPDRPGYGLSDWKPGRTMTDWPDDVAALADVLGLHQFAMIGVSGGGPETLACAWKIPDRLTAVGLMHSPGPPDAPDYFDGMSRTNRFFEAISGLAVIGIAVLMVPLFRPYHKKTSFWYLVFRGIEGGLMIIAGILFLSYSPLLLEIRDGIYVGHAYIFAVAALIFYYLLYQSNLIPRWISVWGVIAAILLILVNLLEVMGIIPALMILYLPIMLNEIVLAIWLMVKGFNPSAIVSGAANRRLTVHA